MIEIMIGKTLADYPQSIAEYIRLKDEIISLEYHSDKLTKDGQENLIALKKSVAHFEKINEQLIKGTL